MRLERNAACLIGPRQDVVKPDIQCGRTHWNRGFMAFHDSADGQGELWMGLAWSAVRRGRGVAGIGGGTGRARVTGALGRGATGRAEAGEGEGRVEGDRRTGIRD
jgi:hypothetical protein